MPTKVVMPQMGESVVEGKVSKWLVKEGDAIQADQPIAEVSTDKVDVEIPAPGAGRMEKILVEEGETVSVGTELALIGDGKEPVEKGGAKTAEKHAARTAPAESAPKPKEEGKRPAPEKKEEVEINRLSPVVKRLAEEHQVDLGKVTGTGIGGRVTKQDVLNHIEHIEKEKPQTSEGAAPPAAEREAPAEQKGAPVGGASPAGTLTEYKVPHVEPKPGDQVIPFSRLRKMIAEHMVYSKRTAPHVTTVAEVDMVKVVRLREEKKAAVKDQTGSDLTFLPFVIAAAIQAIPAYPVVNASVAGQSLIVKKEVHMGIAVETEKGLMVPVIRRAHEKSIVGLSREGAELARKAREGTLTPDEVTGGTFTVSNPGRKGNLFGTPIIFQPQVAILRMGEVIKRAMVVELDGSDTITIRPMMYLSLTYDHRVIDGATGNLFLHRVKEILEEGSFVF